MNQLMKAAIEEARRGFNRDDAGLFGAIIVRDGELIAKGHNEVLKTNASLQHRPPSLCPVLHATCSSQRNWRLVSYNKSTKPLGAKRRSRSRGPAKSVLHLTEDKNVPQITARFRGLINHF